MVFVRLVISPFLACFFFVVGDLLTCSWFLGIERLLICPPESFLDYQEFVSAFFSDLLICSLVLTTWVVVDFSVNIIFNLKERQKLIQA